MAAGGGGGGGENGEPAEALRGRKKSQRWMRRRGGSVKKTVEVTRRCGNPSRSMTQRFPNLLLVPYIEPLVAHLHCGRRPRINSLGFLEHILVAQIYPKPLVKRLRPLDLIP